MRVLGTVKRARWSANSFQVTPFAQHPNSVLDVSGAKSGFTQGTVARLRHYRPDPETGGELDCDGRAAYALLEMTFTEVGYSMNGNISVYGFVASHEASTFPDYPQSYGTGNWVVERWDFNPHRED